MFGRVACGGKLLRRPSAEDTAWRGHPMARFGLVAEHLQRAIPDGLCAGVFKLCRELFGRRWSLRCPHNL